MKKILLFGALILMFGLGVFPVQAETPGHNPDLDNKCGKGTEWSRMTVACEQANCPPGARRNYTLECSCGEAWDEPFRTCMKDGLATHCVAEGVECDSVVSGWDPLTGDCDVSLGYSWNGDKSACIHTFPDLIQCTVVDLEGKPLKNAVIRYGEYTTNMTNADHSDRNTTNSKGEIAFSVKNKDSQKIKVIYKGENGFNNASAEFRTGDSTEGCVITVYSNAQIEEHIKKEMEDFLKDACFPDELIKKIRAIDFDFDSDVANSQYDAENNVLRVSSGDLGTDWNELKKALVHEFGHGISDEILDPSVWYVKGYPLFGKYVGGSHDNWTPHATSGTYPFDIDGEQNAFEEAMADFIAQTYFASQGIVYQEDLQDPDKAAAAIQKHGANQSTRIEAVITNFLHEYYKKQIESGDKGPAQAFGDFVNAMTYQSRSGWTWLSVPSRNIKDFIAATQKSRATEKPNKCTPGKDQVPDIAQLAQDYGFDGKNQPRIRIRPASPEKLDEVASIVDGMLLINPSDEMSIFSLFPKTGETYTFPANLGTVEVEVRPENYAETGEVERVVFGPELSPEFSIDDNNQVTVEHGMAFIENTSVFTPNLFVTHTETSYMVTVDDSAETIEVLEGSVEAEELEAQNDGEKKSVTIEEGKKLDYSVEKGFSKPKKSKLDFEQGPAKTMEDYLKFGLVWAIMIYVLIVGIQFLMKRNKGKA